MKWVSALFVGAILGFTLPLAFGGDGGVWMDSFTRWGTIRPVENSPGLLFSLPLFFGSAIALRLFFNWHGT